MATQAQMMPGMKKITTLSGKTYELPRPWIGFWRKFNEFQAEASAVEEVSISTGQIPAAFLDKYVDFLEAWLGKVYPEITREEIEDDFDPSDIPALMAAIAEFNTEVQATSPPPSPELRRASPTARKKRTGA